MSMIKLLGKTKIEGKTIFATEQSPTYTITRSASSVNEGSSVTFTLNTTNVANGTVLPYTISGISANDVTTGSLTGNFTVNSGLATTTITMSADQLTEGAETATLTLNNAAASNFVVVNDTSTTPVPLTISGLQLWLDAADSSTLFNATAGGSLVTTDGAAVARWADKSGNNRHATQTTANARPILKTSIKNGRNVLRFDGTNDILTSTCSISGFASATVFGVFKRTGTFIGASLGYGGSAGLRLYGENGYPVYFDGRPTGSSAFSSSVAVAGQSTNFVLAGGICTKTNMTAYLNGTAAASTNVSISTIIAQNRTDIGALNPPGQNFCSGDYSEILIYNSALTTTQRQQVETYLNSKWALY